MSTTDREYYYRFEAGAETSPVGRTRTTPALGSPLAGLDFAFASCQSWPDGYYSAYARMAEEDLDLVVHLGDYIYEGGVGPNGGYRNVPVPGHLRRPRSRGSPSRVNGGRVVCLPWARRAARPPLFRPHLTQSFAGVNPKAPLSP